MIFTLLINASPYETQGAQTAYLFSRAALAEGHVISKIFFYIAGTLNGNKLIDPPQDEINLVTSWQTLQKKYGVELVICIAAAARRGIDESNLSEGFSLGGLLELFTAIDNSDRFITFN